MKSTNLTGKNHNRILSLPTRFESRIRKIPRHAFIKRCTFLLNRKRKTGGGRKIEKREGEFPFRKRNNRADTRIERTDRREGGGGPRAGPK